MSFKSDHLNLVLFDMVWYGIGPNRLHSEFHGPMTSGKYLHGWGVSWWENLELRPT